ncbi:hypothetical protein [Streptomyces sp. NPDC056690]|uniref:hypothetical protein n=1 Tax=unclassified Streptomyces TaxID=2593676 RepID=UPI003636A55E
MFIFVPANPGEHRFRDLEQRQHPAVFRELAVTVAVVLIATVLVFTVALLAADTAATLARLDGATYPAAIKQAGVTFAAVITLATAVTGALF